MCIERDQQLQLMRSKGESAVLKPELQEEELDIRTDEPQGDNGACVNCMCKALIKSYFSLASSSFSSCVHLINSNAMLHILLSVTSSIILIISLHYVAMQLPIPRGLYCPYRFPVSS